jgi:WD40 repeat protein
VLRGHGGPVRAVVFSPDGKLIASASEDKTISIWDAATKKEKRSLEGHGEAVTAVAFSPRGQLLASAGADKTMRLWETATGGELANMEEGHSDTIGGIAFAPSGRQIATASADKSVGLWSAALPRVFSSRTFTNRVGPTGVAALSPGGKILAAVGEKHEVLLLDLETGQNLGILRGHRSAVLHLAFSPDGTRLVSCGRDRVGILWEVPSGKRLALLDGHRGVVRVAAFSSDGKLLATGSADKRILIYDLPPAGSRVSELRERLVLEGHKGSISCLAFSPDSKKIATGTDLVTRKGPAEVKLWNVADGTILSSWNDHTGDVATVAFHATRPLLATGGADPGFRVRDLSNKALDVFRQTQTPVTSLTFSPSGTELITGSVGRAMLAWDVEAWHEQARFMGHSGPITGLYLLAGGADAPIFSVAADRSVRSWSLATATVRGTRFSGHESWVTALVLTPDGKKLISGSWDGTVRVWDVETGKADPILESHKSKIYSVAVSRDGKRAASGGGNGEVYLWDLESNSELAHLEGHDEETEINGIAYTPDGKRVVTASADGEIRIWEVPSGKDLGKITGPKEGFLALALTQDGKKALVACGSACILYDLESKKELLRLAGHTGLVNTLAFSPDGSRILTGSADRTVRLWDGGTGKELRKIEAHAGYVKAVQFTADGASAASVGYDHVNRLWDLRNGQMITSYEVHNRPALSVAFSADGKTIFSGGADEYVVRWRRPEVTASK